MDDLQFRRSLFADPNNIDADIQQAIKADSSKEKFADELNKLEQDLQSAFNVDVPEGLCDKLILRQTMFSHKQQKRKNRIQLSIAASVAFAIGLGMNVLQFSSAYNNLSDHALAHLYHEDGVFTNNSPAKVSLTSLNDKMSTFGGNFKGIMGELISADFCRFDSLKSLHLVFKGENSPITVFVIPHDDDLTVTEQFADAKFTGQVIQYRNSNIVVMAEKGENIDQWKNKVSESITWSI